MDAVLIHNSRYILVLIFLLRRIKLHGVQLVHYITKRHLAGRLITNTGNYFSGKLHEAPYSWGQVDCGIVEPATGRIAEIYKLPKN